MTTKVKVCGVTRPQDALAAAEAGAWAVGLVFTPRSPRFVSLDQAREIAAALPAGILRVGVFLDASAEMVRRVQTRVFLDLVQLHGRGAAQAARALGPGGVVAAVALRDEGDVAKAAELEAEYVLADRLRVRGAPCGAGRKEIRPAGTGGTSDTAGAGVDWELFRRLLRSRPKTLLAGGLTAASVAEAVRRLRPWGVDVSGGVESAPGIKDAALVREFIAAVRRGDAG